MRTSHLRCIVLSIFALLFVISANSCDRSSQYELTPSTVISSDSLKIYLAFLEEATGVNNKNISYAPQNTDSLIDGDISTSLEDVRVRYKIRQNNKVAKIKQWRYVYTVNRNTVKHIKIFITSGVPSAWISAVDDAIEYWNSIPNTHVQFKRTFTQSQAQITVSLYQAEVGTYASAQSPLSSGQPGTFLKINTTSSAYSSGSTLLRKNIITHELGHNIGFMHTDGYYDIVSNNDYDPNAQRIPGTPEPGQDPTSIMNKAVTESLSFSAYDLVAIRTVYPFSFDSFLDKPRGDVDQTGGVSVTWDKSVISSTVTLKIDLYDASSVFVKTLIANAQNTGGFSATGSRMNVPARSYFIRISVNEGTNQLDFSDDPFRYVP